MLKTVHSITTGGQVPRGPHSGEDMRRFLHALHFLLGVTHPQSEKNFESQNAHSATQLDPPTREVGRGTTCLVLPVELKGPDRVRRGGMHIPRVRGGWTAWLDRHQVIIGKYVFLTCSGCS